MSEKQHFMQNRELSWLNFNERVLQEALEADTPLMEKMLFLNIFCSNLDEFCMVRVGSLVDLCLIKNAKVDSKTGLKPIEQIEKVFERMHELYQEKDRVYATVEEEMRKNGIIDFTYMDLNKSQRKSIESYFNEYIFPILSPQVVNLEHPLPFLENKKEYIFVRFKEDGPKSFGLVMMPDALSRIVRFGSSTGVQYIRTSHVTNMFLEKCFPNKKIVESTIIRVTRNADLNADDEITYDVADYREHMKKILKKRKRLQAVRIEVNKKISDHMKKIICDQLEIEPYQILYTQSPLSMDYFKDVRKLLDNEFIYSHSYETFTPQRNPEIYPNLPMETQILKKDILLSYPYESINSFLRLLYEAATNEDVVSIKITIYRLAKNSRIVDMLCLAAENGKKVTCFMELRARFDEQSNLDYSKKLYESGCTIMYGMPGFKNHSKVCQITYKDKNEWRYITQIGTGNYNEQTAAQYTDFCLMTAHQGIGKDCAQFFMNLGVGELDGHYEYILQSPTSLKSGLLEKIDKEIMKGEEGYLCFKMNSFTDKDFINKLAAASQAGVKIDMIVRGISCLLPGIEGITENIHIRSVVGRFLEHERVYIFGKEDPQIYIGSADLMTRNTEKRVEVLCPVLDPHIKEKILTLIHDQLKDTEKARAFQPDGSLARILDQPYGEDCQKVRMKAAIKAAEMPLPVIKKKSKLLERFKNLFKRKQK